jgi:hypothetical protein
MIKWVLLSVVLTVTILLAGGDALPHVPFLEDSDFSESKPFVLEHPLKKSRAVYAWLDSGTDIDVYTFELQEQSHLRAFSLVPVCPAYKDFLPSFAVVGPGLALPEEELPFKVPEGYGAVIVTNTSQGISRNTFFEPFTRKNYYRGPSYDQTISTPGTWYVYFWDPAGKGGDYVAVFGFTEQFSFRDIMRAFSNTPKIWFDRELHTDCK